MSDRRTVIVVSGGDAFGPEVLDDLPHEAFIVAADSGLDHALAVGMEVDLIIGDLDSVTAAALASSRGIPIEQYPTTKSLTDLELALEAATRLEAERIIVVGGHGGRVDHFLGNVAAIASPGLWDSDVEWICGDSHIYVIRDSLQLHGTKGDTVSLVPVGGDATGVTTVGLTWELTSETLSTFSARGVSNTFKHPIAQVSMDSGTLLAVLNG